MIKCDNCNEEFELITKVKKTNGIEEVYFKCSHCKVKYISYFTNKNIRIKQKNINKLWQKYKKCTTEDEAIEMMKNIDTMRIEIKVDMNNLKKKMLGTR